MANSIELQITEEGPRNAVVKITGILDSSNESRVEVIDPDDFFNNETRAVLTGFRVDLIEWSISNGLEVNLFWHGNTPQHIYPLAGRGRIYAANYGGFVPDPLRSGYSGGIDLVTAGFTPGTVQNFSIILELVKLYKV